MLEQVLVPIHRAGWPFIAVFFGASILLGFIWQPLFWLGLLTTAWCVYFFRDPPRVTPDREGLVISPADGRVQAIGPAVPPAGLGLPDEETIRVGIFLNIFDVHVNRAPVDGRIMAVSYRAGKFLNASLDKASEENERNAIAIETPDGKMLAFVQIAGLVARRIVCHIKQGDTVSAGERFGMIRFGSRVDVYLPKGAAPLVVVGQRAVAGETVIADLASDEAARQGALR